MLDFSDEQKTAFVVGSGLVIGHLFIYGRKVKKNIKIKASELIGDAMQLGAMFVGAMSFLNVMDLMGIRPTDTWQTVMVTILFALSFEAYFQKARELFQARMGAVVGAMLGKLPEDAMMHVPEGNGVPDDVTVELPEDGEYSAKKSVGQNLRKSYAKTDKEVVPIDLTEKLDELKEE